ncbi:MAG: UvrD-helicase domain-containing protein [Thiotrichaceae bacterium]|nr:UvrD-helicase domain-containing protein [Thiotrichaceae bacterium]
MRELNLPQREAIKHIHSPLLVLAGAGSGKTRVITKKIAWMIQEAGISPKQIIAVTFTNKAAREMQSRVSQLLHGKEGQGLTVSTFHTLGLNILRREHKFLGYKANLSIFDNHDSHSLLRDLLQHEEDINADYLDKLQSNISRYKNNFIVPEQALELAQDEAAKLMAGHYAAYQRQLKAYNAADFDDLIMQPVQLFQQHPEVLARWQQRVKHLLVDEYQDTNATQYQLLKLLVGKHGVFTVVGDDDQSIYAWRGAQPENMRLLAKDYPSLKVIKLEQNYRSSNRILKLANHLIGNNPHVFEKKLWSDKGAGEMTRVIVTDDQVNEAEKVVTEIMHHKFKHRTEYEDYAILYRSNHQSRHFEAALRSFNIPYFVSGGTSFFSRAEVKDILAYLRLLANPVDDNAFLRIANVPRREVGTTTLEKLGIYANSRNVALLHACFEFNLTTILSRRNLDVLLHFADWVKTMATRAETEPPNVIARAVVEGIRYEAWLKETSETKEAAKRRMSYVDDLLDWLDQLAEKYSTLSELVSHIMLLDILERQNADAQQKGVALMTFHAAKGLEFPHVFMVGMEEDLLPHHNSTDDAAIQEERRLAYVGITRAQKSLTFTLADKRKRYGKLEGCDPSRFLKELPENELEWFGKRIPTALQNQTPEEKKSVGNAHLAHLKSLLANK